MTQPSYTGYPATVWSTCYQCLVWLNGILANSTDPAIVANPALVVLQTLRNGSTAIEAWQTGAALENESLNLIAVEALPIVLDPVTTEYFSNRIASIASAADQISALPSVAQPFNVATKLQQGIPAIASSGYLEWAMTFEGEAIPTGLVSPDDLLIYATNMAQAWLTVANAIAVVQGSQPTAAFDTAARQYRCSATISNLIAQLDSGPFAMTDILSLWNSVVAMPTILLDGSALSTMPSLLQIQQAMTIRNTLDKTANSIAVFLYSLRTVINSAPMTAILTNNDTLLDLAARETGDFENWVKIASINSLKPPYPGPTNQTLAQKGRQLYLPGSSVTIGASDVAPSYPNDAMGTDYWFGPINGNQPMWKGDIPLITGLINFAGALGRRLQTPIGSLVYHQEYGSRIPAEVGSIQTIDEANRIAAYGKAALAADKRTGQILSAKAAVFPGSLATFAGVVTPIGPGTNPVQINTQITPTGSITSPGASTNLGTGQRQRAQRTPVIVPVVINEFSDEFTTDFT